MLKNEINHKNFNFFLLPLQSQSVMIPLPLLRPSVTMWTVPFICLQPILGRKHSHSNVNEPLVVVVLVFRIFATFSWYVCQYLLDVFVSVLVVDQWETLFLSLSPMSEKFNENKKNNINMNRHTIWSKSAKILKTSTPQVVQKVVGLRLKRYTPWPTGPYWNSLDPTIDLGLSRKGGRKHSGSARFETVPQTNYHSSHKNVKTSN